MKIYKCEICGSGTNRVECVYDKYIYVRCLYCDFVFLGNPPSKTYLDKLYSKDEAIGDDAKHNKLLNLLMRTYIGRMAFQILKLLIYKSRADSIVKFGTEYKLLDLGCGNGEFILYMKRKNWDVYGLEVSKKLADNARIRTSSKIYESNIQDLNVNRKFQVVSMWHVFEHLINPRQVISKINSLIIKNGLLVIEVPCSNSFTFSQFKDSWTLLLNPQHLHFWSEKSFRILLEKDFKVEKFEYPISFPFVFISSLVNFNSLFMYIVPVLLPFSVLLALFHSKHKEGEVIRVYARKK